MMAQRTLARTALLAGGALAVALAAGCAGQQNATGTASTTTSDTAAATTTVSTTTASGGSAASNTGTASGGNTGSGAAGGSPARNLECKAANLKLSLGNAGAAAGSAYQPLQFTNVGTTSCVMVGFPGVSYVTGQNGQQVGAPAARSGAFGKQITLAPGQMASAVVQLAQVANFDPTVCKPTSVQGLRVYAPDDTAAMYIDRPGTGCAGNTPSPQLLVQTIKAGNGNI